MSKSLMANERVELSNNGIQFFWSHREKTKKTILKSKNILDWVPEKILIKIQAKEELKNTDISSLISSATNPEDYLEACFQIEQNKESKAIEKVWVGGLEKFNNSVLYLENLGFYFFQIKQFHKALDYLTKSHQISHSFFALTLAIASSYAVGQYHLVWDYFTALSKNDQKKLDDNMLSKVATAALHKDKHSEAIELFQYIRDKNQLPELPALKDTLINKFGNEKKLTSWVKEIEPQMSAKKHRKEMNLTDMITYGTALMYMDRFDDALKMMSTVKKERF